MARIGRYQENSGQYSRCLAKQLHRTAADRDRLKGLLRDRSQALVKMQDLLRQQTHRLGISKAEASLAEAQLYALTNASIDHIYVLDRSGTFLFSNDRVQQFGLKSGSDLVGKTLRDVFAHQTFHIFLENLSTVFEDGELVFFNHQKIVNGVPWHFANSFYPINIAGQVWAVGGICHDISRHKIVENQLLQAQKMEALGTLVAGVAHEINNPINLIIFNLPLLERIWRDLIPLLGGCIEKTSDVKIGGLSYEFIETNLPRLISDMDMAAQRVVRIVSGLKDFSRKGNPAETSLIQVNQAVENATLLVGAALNNLRSELSLDLAAELPLLHANLHNLEQIVVNLLINAGQAIHHNRGRIHLSTFLRKDDNYVVIQVTDNGRGVNPAVAEKIFDPFVTDRQADGGTGLGLSVTYNLVKALNGDISFQTSIGKGTTFTVALPTESTRKRYKVMVVDDDRMFRKLLQDALAKQADSIVEGFENGAEALIRLGSQPPDLLILDMFMPEIDGLGVCRAIKNEMDLELTKVIIVTGFPDHPNLHEAARMGFVQIFTKPLVIEKFIAKVQEILHGKSS